MLNPVRRPLCCASCRTSRHVWLKIQDREPSCQVRPAIVEPHLRCADPKSHGDSNCRSISQWSRPTRPANLLRAGRPTRRKLTTVGSKEAIDCVANLITAVTCFSHLNLLLVDPTSARNGIGWPFFRSEDWKEWVDYIARSLRGTGRRKEHEVAVPSQSPRD